MRGASTSLYIYLLTILGKCIYPLLKTILLRGSYNEYSTRESGSPARTSFCDGRITERMAVLIRSSSKPK